MASVDPKLKTGFLNSCLLSSKNYYVLPQHHQGDDAYKELVEGVIPPNWKYKKDRLWWYVSPIKQHKLPEYGFKIHISSTIADSESLLHLIQPILYEFNAPFKVVRNKRLHEFVNSQNIGKTESGKFVTIYPCDVDQLKQLLFELYEVTKCYTGPRITTDNTYKDSKVIYYRYGLIRSIATQCDVTGLATVQKMKINGRYVDDIRVPYYILPEGIVDPFGWTPAYSKVPMLNGRYTVLKCLSPSATKGGVYLCQDSETNDKVIIKEARPNINETASNQNDATKSLEHEANILGALSHLNVTPKVLEFFVECRHSFLVIEYFQLEVLGNPKYLTALRPALQRNVTQEDVKKIAFSFLHLLENLIDAVSLIHSCGIIIGDLSPRNILFNPQTFKIKLIDFEGACNLNESFPPTGVTTPGFVSQQRLVSKDHLVPEDDYYSLSVVAFHIMMPLSPFISINPDFKHIYLKSIVEFFNFPLMFISLFRVLETDLSKARKIINDLRSNYDQQVLTLNEKPAESGNRKETTILEIIKHTLASSEITNSDLLFPSGCLAFITNPLSVSYGAVGVMYFLHKNKKKLTPKLKEKLHQHLNNIDTLTYPPGLYVGLAGIAWLLNEMNFKEEAKNIIVIANTSPHIFKSADLFYGAAGWGLTNLYFHKNTGDKSYLEAALKAAESIETMLIDDDGCIFYKNIDSEVYSGLMHGSAGIGLFYLRLFEIYKDSKFLNMAKKLLAHDLEKAECIEGFIEWRQKYSSEVRYPYIRFGDAGIGMVAIRFYAVLKDDLYLRYAEKIAKSLTGKYTIHPGLFCGMAGIGEFFIDMYRYTDNKEYLIEAHKIATRVMLYATNTCEGVGFPSMEFLRLSNDYGTGSSGIGMFLHRLDTLSDFLFLDL